MSKATTMTSAAIPATKKPSATKTTGKTEADYRLTTPSGHLVSKIYGLGTINKFAMSFNTKGLTDFALDQFYVNGMLTKKGGYLTTLLEDGHTIRWSRPVDSFLFTMEHLCFIMGSKYLDSIVRVSSFNQGTRAIYKDKIKPKANRNYWGEPQEIHLKKRCRGMPETVTMPYKAPYPLKPVTNPKGRRHYQFNTVVLVKVQLADQCKTAKKTTKTKLVDLYEIESSSGHHPSPGARCRSRKHDWGGSHHEASRRSRVSKEIKERDESKEY